jgi:hypothetical protein
VGCPSRFCAKRYFSVFCDARRPLLPFEPERPELRELDPLDPFELRELELRDVFFEVLC